ncbi:hypothetical protein [Lysinibacillus sp. ZYM-1]|uniref:hypothetical protein n=1 Tax=Lysinibacillus sp. ZYM-1 TaxID=1681184 RepID=UPI000ADBA6AC|nr:hypothetical protein [Lysinibacillus sp. ZYM-1]
MLSEFEELQQTIARALLQHNYIVLIVWEHANYVQWGGIIQGVNEEELLLETITATPLRFIYAARIELNGDD